MRLKVRIEHIAAPTQFYITALFCFESKHLECPVNRRYRLRQRVCTNRVFEPCNISTYSNRNIMSIAPYFATFGIQRLEKSIPQNRNYSAMATFEPVVCYA